MRVDLAKFKAFYASLFAVDFDAAVPGICISLDNANRIRAATAKGAPFLPLTYQRNFHQPLDEMLPNSTNRPHEKLIQFVTDRPGHDARYAIDAGKIATELGWRPRHDFDAGLRETVRWFLENRGWWERVMSGAYRGERLGLR